MDVNLVWFRNDLRINDNLALYHACKKKDSQVIAVYIATPEQWKKQNLSARQAWFIFQHLLQLQAKLNELNIPLIYQQVTTFDESVTAIDGLCKKYQINNVYFNKQYEWNELKRDNKLCQLLLEQQIKWHIYDDSLLIPPGKILTNNGNMYQIFAPFMQRYHHYFLHNPITIFKKPRKQLKLSTVKSNMISIFDYPCLVSENVLIGEREAQQILQTFCEHRVNDYQTLRDIPAINGTSQLAAYLNIGVISPRQCLNALITEHPELFDFIANGAYSWFRQLVWRDFYRHLLIFYPQISKNVPFIEWTQHIKWRNNKAEFLAWQNGQTGFPIVDAAMRQLRQTGWMHNRLRLITASFLVKDLLIDWRWGESYFMSQLIDGDLAANNGGWQWSASTGTDAAPYFRIFNPTIQGKKFDPQGKFIRQYLPELIDVPDNHIHQPHKWAEQQSITLNYPKPIVDHAKARLFTIESYNIAKSLS